MDLIFLGVFDCINLNFKNEPICILKTLKKKLKTTVYNIFTLYLKKSSLCTNKPC